MANLARRVQRRTPFLTFLAQELAPREGRGLAAARIAAACTITVAIAMVFRIPLAAYMAYMVFLTSKDDSAATMRMAVAGGLAITLAVIFSLGLAQISLGDPAIRLPAMALTTSLASDSCARSLRCSGTGRQLRSTEPLRDRDAGAADRPA